MQVKIHKVDASLFPTNKNKIVSLREKNWKIYFLHSHTENEIKTKTKTKKK